jgi:hypothetical protein
MAIMAKSMQDAINGFMQYATTGVRPTQEELPDDLLQAISSLMMGGSLPAVSGGTPGAANGNSGGTG